MSEELHTTLNSLPTGKYTYQEIVLILLDNILTKLRKGENAKSKK